MERKRCTKVETWSTSGDIDKKPSLDKVEMGRESSDAARN